MFLFSPPGLHPGYFKTQPQNSAGAADLPVAEPFHVRSGNILIRSLRSGRRGGNGCIADSHDRKHSSLGICEPTTDLDKAAVNTALHVSEKH